MVNSDLARRTWGVHDEATPDEKARASRYIASVADGPADCRLLLDVLGLLPALLTVEHGMPGYRKGCRCKRCRKANANRNQRQRAAAQRTTTVTDCPINTTTNYGGTE